MAFTGRLGTEDSQLGNIVLGSEGSSLSVVEDDFSVSAIVLDTVAASFGIDAIVLAEESASAAFDAFLSSAVSDTFDLDAVVLGTAADAFSVDGVILVEQSASFALDAHLVEIVSDAFDLEAVVLAVQTASANANAVIFNTVLVAFGVDAAIGTDTDGFGLDAYIIGTRQHSRTLAHFGSQPDTAVTDLNQTLASLFSRVDSLAGGAKAFGVAAYLLDASTGSFGVNATLASQWTLSMSATIRAVSKASFGCNAVIVST